MLCTDLVAGFCGLALTILDVMCFVKDHSEEFKRKQPAVRATVTVLSCYLTKLRENHSIAGNDEIWRRYSICFAAQTLEIRCLLVPIVDHGFQSPRI